MRSRLRSTFKWGCTVLTALLLVLWVGSVWWGVRVHSEGAGPLLDLDRGRLFCIWFNPRSHWPEGIELEAIERHDWSMAWGFTWRREFISRQNCMLYLVGIPMWSLVLVTGGPCARLWYRDRRRAPERCAKCGYDLRGSVTGVCPECGAGATS